MSLLGKKPFMTPGANPFTALQIQRSKRELDGPKCAITWTSKVRPSIRAAQMGMNHEWEERHKCTRFEGHRASCVCGCGATHHTAPNRRKRKR